MLPNIKRCRSRGHRDLGPSERSHAILRESKQSNNPRRRLRISWLRWRWSYKGLQSGIFSIHPKRHHLLTPFLLADDLTLPNSDFGSSLGSILSQCENSSATCGIANNTLGYTVFTTQSSVCAWKLSNRYCVVWLALDVYVAKVICVSKLGSLPYPPLILAGFEA